MQKKSWKWVYDISTANCVLGQVRSLDHFGLMTKYHAVIHLIYLELHLSMEHFLWKMIMDPTASVTEGKVVYELKILNSNLIGWHLVALSSLWHCVYDRFRNSGFCNLIKYYKITLSWNHLALHCKARFSGCKMVSLLLLEFPRGSLFYYMNFFKTIVKAMAEHGLSERTLTANVGRCVIACNAMQPTGKMGKSRTS